MSSADEQLRELERKAQREPKDLNAHRDLAAAFQRQGQLKSAIQTLIHVNLFNATDPCGRAVGLELKALQRKTLHGIDGLYHLCQHFNESAPIDWQYRGPGNSVVESLQGPVLGLGNLSFEDCEQIREDPDSYLWLHSLTLNAPQPKDDILEWISGLPFLRYLELNFEIYEETHNQRLRHCPALTHLILGVRSMSPTGQLFQNREFLNRLTRLSYSGPIPDELIDLSGMKEARDIGLRDYYDDSKRTRILLPEHLQNLVLTTADYSGKETLESLSKLKALKSLALESNADHEVDGTFLAGMESLESLTDYGRLRLTDLRLLPQPQLLKSLCLHRNRMEPGIVEVLGEFTELRELSFGLPIEFLHETRESEEFGAVIDRMKANHKKIDDIFIEGLF